MAALTLPATGSVALVDADVSTITAQADKVLRVGGPSPWLLHLELQASRDLVLPRRLLRYNVLLYGRHGLPVHTAVVLLRPESDDPPCRSAPEAGRSASAPGPRILRELVAGTRASAHLAKRECGYPRRVSSSELRRTQPCTCRECLPWSSRRTPAALERPLASSSQNLLSGTEWGNPMNGTRGI
jgi:hypothetical protein